jgi:phosphoribosylglycinamide formyltransferase, formyltetrahydrofolate-dependent
MRVAVLVSGGGTNLQAILNAVNDGRITNVTICGVISNRPDAFALQRAERAGVPGICVSRKAYATRAEFEEALLGAVDSLKPDLIVLAGFLVIIPPEMIRRYERRIINIHPSLIPSFCGDGFYGLHVHEAVLARGVKVTGATVHYVDEGTDTGPILLQQAVAVQPGDTPEVLQRRVMEQAEWIILPQAIDAIANDRVSRDSNGNYFLTTD